MWLMWLRGLFLVILLLWLLYVMNPSVEMAVTQRWQGVKTHYARVKDFLEDRRFEVPEEDRKPAKSWHDFRMEKGMS